MGDISRATGNAVKTATVITGAVATDVVITSATSSASRQVRQFAIGWAQFTSGTATATVDAFVGRYNGNLRNPLVASNGNSLQTAVGQTESQFVMGAVEALDLDGGTYSMTLRQNSAVANGNCVQSAVLVLNL